ncbi:MAG: hypothetical protein FWH11_06825 [Micrococcales bacterium]|nr:hypothetical protein [Micrococcales bacterium]
MADQSEARMAVEPEKVVVVVRGDGSGEVTLDGMEHRVVGDDLESVWVSAMRFVMHAAVVRGRWLQVVAHTPGCRTDIVVSPDGRWQQQPAATTAQPGSTVQGPAAPRADETAPAELPVAAVAQSGAPPSALVQESVPAPGNSAGEHSSGQDDGAVADLTAASPVDAVTPGPVSVPTTGPSVPQQGVTPPDPPHCLPVRVAAGQPSVHTGQPTVWVLGCHGGAGESTLAALAPGWQDAHHAWPGPGLVLLTARTSVRGLMAAQAAARHWASGQTGADLLGLVLIADAPGRIARPVRDLVQVVSGGVPRVWRLPWDEEWRLGADPATTQPAKARRLVADVTALVRKKTPR